MIKYVNTASTPGGTGLTNAVSGIDRAYSSISLMEASEQSDLEFNKISLIVYCSGFRDDYHEASFNLGWNTSPNYYIKICGNIIDPTGENSGNFNKIKYTIKNKLTIGLNHFRLEKIQINGPILIDIKNKTESDIHLLRNIMIGSNYDDGIHINNDNIIGSINIKNNIIYDFNHGIKISRCDNNAEINVINNTINNCNTPISQLKGLIYYTNNIDQNCNNDHNGSYLSGSGYNLTDRSHLPGTNNILNVSLSFNLNLNISSSNVNAIDTGIGPEAYHKVPTIDINNNVRTGSITDIGANLAKSVSSESIPDDRPLFITLSEYVHGHGHKTYTITEENGLKFYGYFGHDDSEIQSLVITSNMLDERNSGIDDYRKLSLLALAEIDPNTADPQKHSKYP